MDFAIVGMACRLPGANSIGEYWDLIRAADSRLGPLPEDRLNRKLYFNSERGVVGKSYSDLGGTVPSRSVDFTQLPLPDELIEGRDIAHLILCDVAASALRDAGYDPFALKQRNAGVYIGHTGGSAWISDLVYSTIVAEGAQYLLDSPLFRGLGASAEAIVKEVIDRTRQSHGSRQPLYNLDLSALAGSALISQAFGLHGPYMVVDAACASSLQAMAVGLRALLQGRIDMALVGGASYCKSDSLVLFSAAQSVSSVGSCPFGEQADGLVSAEGYVVLAVKTLNKALADGDRIRAVIRGVGVSSDGKGKSLWAPRKEGQQLAMMRAYARNIDPRRLQYIEAHATSTQVGDATELQALSETLGKLLPAGTAKIPVGSSKGNVGHTLETAGMAGLVKVVMAMENQTIPPAVGDGRLNTEIDWASMPIYVPFQEQAWAAHQDGHPRCAAVNAFGIGGLNVHIVLDEFSPQHHKTAPKPVASTGVNKQEVSNDDRAIAVIGAGCIFPGANTLAAFWDLLASGRSALVPVPPGRWTSELFLEPGEAKPFHTYNNVGGFITDFVYDWRRHKVPPKQIEAANPLQFMLLDAADQALQDAGYREKPFDSTRAAVVVGTIFGGDFSDQLQMGLRFPEFEQTLGEVLRARGVNEADIGPIAEQFKTVLLKKMPALVDETGSFTSSTLASRITKTFNLMGGALALDAGMCSAPFALQAGVDMLLEQDADLVVCAAGQRSMDQYVFESFSLQKTLSRGLPQPFGANADGFVPGEGCGVVVLKRLSDARRDGDRIRAVIRGIGAARHNQSVVASEEAIRLALADAQLPPSAVAGVEAFGFGVPQDDAAELIALDRAYGATQRTQPLVVGSLSAQIGITNGAAGMASLLKTAYALQQGQLPASHAFNEPSPVLASHPNLRVSGRAEPLPAASAEGYRAVGVHTMQNDMAYHLIVDNGVRAPRIDTQQKPLANSLRFGSLTTSEHPWRIFRWSGNDRTSLCNQLQRAGADVAALFNDNNPFAPNDPWRLAIVADSPATLAKRLNLAREAVKTSARPGQWDEQGIFLIEGHLPRRKVAAVFPGQGSQYPGMLRDLCAVSPAAKEACAEALEVMARHGWDLFDDFAWQNPETLGHDVWHTQAGMLVAHRIAMQAATAMGLRPDYIGAHSFGEFGALVAAGAWTLEEALLATRARCDAVRASRAQSSTMLSVLESAAKVRLLLAEQANEVWLCAINGPEQSVVGGSEQAIERFAQRCTQQRIKNKRLQVPCAFHTPLLSDTQAPLASALAAREITPPTTPLISSTCARFLSDPNDIRESLVRQMTEPVQYLAHVRRLYDLGVRVFVEVGPSQVLTQLNRRILADTNDVYLTSIDHPNRTAAEQCIRFQAFLETLNLVRSAVTARRIAITLTSAIQKPTIVAPVEEAVAVAAAATIASAPPAILSFDATQRRRDRHRSSGKSAAAAPAAKVAAQVNGNGNGSHTTESPVAIEKVPAVQKTPPPAKPVRAAEHHDSHAHANGSANGNGHSNGNGNGNGNGHGKADWLTTGNGSHAQHSAPVAAAKSSNELQEFLIQFVVEQTGYPAEIVELDADLEADLGIDSIKKAQLFGEIGEQFHLEADPNLSLDDFPTLRHVLQYLMKQRGENVSDAPPPPAPPRRPDVASPTAGHGHTVVEVRPAFVESAVAVIDPPQVGAELQAFLVDFVVEQTGYPAEIVELDADLEADLGIDSIKKAQLFGEIGEQFQLAADPDLSLDDFPTLRHVLAYLEAQPGVVSSAATATSPLHATNGRHHVEELIAVAAPTFTTLAVEVEPAVATTADDRADLQAFLINFVVEQTGYPAEIVELDADLEADLGIDSIKKAQLFGEIGEQFHLQADDNLSLDDFSTLRHVLVYLQQQLPAASGASTARPSVNGSHHATPAKPAVLKPTSAAYEQGFARGRTDAPAIMRQLRELACRLTPAQAVAIAQNRWLELSEEAERDQLRGIAHGAGVLEENLIALNYAQAIVSLLPVGCHANTSSLAGLVIEVANDGTLTVNDAGQICCTGLIGALAGVNEQGLAAAAWSSTSSASAIGKLPVGALIGRVLRSCSDVASAVTFLKQLGVPAGAAISLSDSGASSITVVPANERSEVVCRAVGSQWSTPEAAALSTSGSIDQALARLEQNLRGRALRCAAALQGQPSRQYAALCWNGKETLAVTSDDGNLSANVPWTPVQLSLRPPLVVSSQAETVNANAITQRYVVRLTDVTANSAGTRRIQDPVLLIGATDESQALATELRSQGHAVAIMPASADVDATIAAMERECASNLPRTLVLFTARDEALPLQADGSAWQKRRNAGVIAPYFVCQRWLTLLSQNKAAEGAMLMAVTSLGGDFGIAGNVGSPEGGALSGLLKAISHEYARLQVKIVDPSPAFTAQQLAAALAKELAVADREPEIALHPSQRLAPRPALQAISPNARTVRPQRGSTWLVTGGARGVTAVVARELGRRYGVKLHLLGSTALQKLDPALLLASDEQLKTHRAQLMVDARRRGEDPLIAWKAIEKTLEIERNLSELRAAGVDATYHACDVANRAELAKLLDVIRRQSGPIAGIVHGAGFEAAARFEKKKRENVERTVSAKNDGAAALIALTKNDPVECFLAFGSTSGRMGGMGQTDYSMANDLLAKQVDQLRRERPTCRATVFHWHAWDEVGMAARPESRFALESFGLHFMPLAEGVEHLVAELEAGLPEPEVMLTEAKLCPSAIAVDAGVTPLPAKVEVAAAPAMTPTAPAADAPDWAAFLVNFVVEQTGYPAEIVELDADLEADLGIDSIKKAQLFGEIGEQFGLEADENLSLDDFPTLRDVIGYLEQKIGPGAGSATATASTAVAAPVTTVNATVSSAPAVNVSPLLDRVISHQEQAITFGGTLDPIRDVFLREHLMLQRPLLPGVMGLEFLAQAGAAAAGESDVVRMRDVVIHQGMRFLNDDPREVTVAVTKGTNGWQAKLQADFRDRSGRVVDPNRLHVSGMVETDGRPSAPMAEYSPAPFPLNAMIYQEDVPMYHGKAFRKLESLMFQHDGGFGKLRAPDAKELAGERRAGKWFVPAALLDGCLVGCSVYSFLMCGQRVEIPQRFDHLEFFRDARAKETCWLRFFLRGVDDMHARYDFILFGEDHSPILQCHGFGSVQLSTEERE